MEARILACNSPNIVEKTFVLEERKGRGRCLIADKDLHTSHCIIEERVALWRCSRTHCILCMSNDGHTLLECKLMKAKHGELQRFGLDLVESKRADSYHVQGLLSPLLLGSNPHAHKVMPLLKSLVKHCPSNDPVLSTLQAIYEAAPDSYKTQLSLEDYVDLYYIGETNAHTMDAIDGNGVFPLVAMLNHSCRPNCSYHSSDSQSTKLIVSLTQPVSKGTELTVSYVELYTSVAMRMRSLRAKFGFVCDCQWCVGPDRARAFCCPFCPQGIVYPKGRGNKDSDFKCSLCNATCEKDQVRGMRKEEDSLLRIGKVAPTTPGLEIGGLLPPLEKVLSCKTLHHSHWYVYWAKCNAAVEMAGKDAKESLKLIHDLVAAFYVWYGAQQDQCIWDSDFVSLLSMWANTDRGPKGQAAAQLVELIQSICSAQPKRKYDMKQARKVYWKCISKLGLATSKVRNK